MMVFRAFGILCLVLALSACQSGSSKQKIEEENQKRAVLHYRLGIDALHKGALPRAFEELLLSNQIEPDQPNTLDAIAHAWRMRGNNEHAKEYYEQAIGEGAGSATYNNYGSLLIEMGDFPLAIKQLHTALKDPRYPNQAFAFTNLGDAYIGSNHFEDGIAAYHKAHMLAPNQNYSQLREAEAYIKFERLHYAQALYETILKKQPSSQDALIGLTKLLKNKKEYALLKQYIDSFINASNNELEKAWAQDELDRLYHTGKP